MSATSGIELLCCAASYLKIFKKSSVVYCHDTTKDMKKSQVFTWGNGLQGQLGHGDYSNQSLPKLLEAFQLNKEMITQCSCGSSHTACVTDAGKVFTWGRTQDNRLGHNNHSGSLDQPIPKEINGLRVTSVCCGESHTLGITEEGQVVSWGKNNRGQCGRPDPLIISALPSESKHFLNGWRSKNMNPVIIEDVWAHRHSIAPAEVGIITSGFLPETIITAAACGKHHSLALSSDGDVYVWGVGTDGQLGTGDKDIEDKLIPTRLPQTCFNGKKIIQVAAGSQFSAAITEDGELYTWGSDQYGQLGHGKEDWKVFTPRLVRGLHNYRLKEVSCGQYHMAAVTESGEVFTWGYGREGQLGLDGKTDISIPTIVDQLGNRNLAVSCGGGHTAVIQLTDKKDATLWVFGRGREGQLGRANHLESIVANRLHPVEIEMFNKNHLDVVQITCGQDHTLAICIPTKSSTHIE